MSYLSRSLRRSVSVCTFLLFSVSAPVSAVVLVTEGDLLVGARSVLVGGLAYNVSFVDGSCVSLFQCFSSNFAFRDDEAAKEASKALMNTVFVDGVIPFDTHPETTRGCESATVVCSLLTPYQYVQGPSFQGVRIQAFVNAASELSDGISLAIPRITDDTGRPGSFETYAIWSLAAIDTEIPEPTSIALVGVGVLALGWSHRRRRVCLWLRGA